MFQNFTCNTENDNSAKYSFVDNTFADHRFLMSMIFLQWLFHINNSKFQNIWINQLTCVFCKSFYNINKYSMLYTQDQNISIWKSVKIFDTNSSLKKFQKKDFILTIQTTFANVIFEQKKSNFVVVIVSLFFQLMKQSSKSDLTFFMNSNLLFDVESRIYKKLNTQIIQQYFIKIENVIIFDFSSYKQNRLQIKRLIVKLMFTCFDLIFCLNVLKFFVRFWNNVLCDSNSINSLIVIFAISKNVKEILFETDFVILIAISYRLFRKKFQFIINKNEQNVFF